MAEARLIAAYLDELYHDVRTLADADDIVAEVEDHLLEARDAFERRGLAPLEAELQALAQFGTPSLVSRALIIESRKGSAVASTFTRRAGFAALALPFVAMLGALLMSIGDDKTLVRNTGIVLLTLTLALFVLAVLGLRRRHRGALGAWGTAAFALFLTSPLIAFPFGWGAAVVFIIVLIVAILLLAVGMLRAGVLPRAPIALFGFAGSVGIVAALPGETMPLVYLGFALVAFGLGWLGWVMWHEDALDVSSGPTPLATA